MIYLSIPFGIHEDREQTPGAVLRVQIQGESGFLECYIPEHFLERLEEIGAFREYYRMLPSVHLYPRDLRRLFGANCSSSAQFPQPRAGAPRHVDPRRSTEPRWPQAVACARSYASHFCCPELIVQAPGFGKGVVDQLRGVFLGVMACYDNKE